MKKGKRYQECEKLIDNTKNYNAKEALEAFEKMPKPKFDETVELHVNKLEEQLYFQMVQVKLKEF